MKQSDSLSCYRSNEPPVSLCLHKGFLCCIIAYTLLLYVIYWRMETLIKIKLQTFQWYSSCFSFSFTSCHIHTKLLTSGLSCPTTAPPSFPFTYSLCFPLFCFASPSAAFLRSAIHFFFPPLHRLLQAARRHLWLL